MCPGLKPGFPGSQELSRNSFFWENEARDSAGRHHLADGPRGDLLCPGRG